MQRHLKPFSLGYKWFLCVRNFNELQPKCISRSVRPAWSRTLTSSSSSQGSAGGKKTSLPEDTDNQSPVEVKGAGEQGVNAEFKPVTTAVLISEAKVEPRPEAKVEPTPEAKVELTPEAKVELTPEAKVELTPEAKVELTPEAKVELTPEAKVEPTPEAKVELTPEAKVELTPEAKVEITPVANVEATPEAKTEATSEAKIEVKPETKVGFTSNTKLNATSKAETVTTEAKVETTSEVKVDIPSESEVEVKPEASKEVYREAEVVSESQLLESPACQTEVKPVASGAAAEGALDTTAKLDAASEIPATSAAPVSATKEETAPEKGGKKGLLELLGAMKVDVTAKRKVTIQRPSQNEQYSRSKAPPQARASHEATREMFQEASAAAAGNVERRSALAPELVAAATAAASTLPNQGQATSELLRQLRRHEAQTQSRQRGGGNISDIIADMKVGKQTNGRPDARPSSQIRFDEDGRGYTHDRGITSELDGVRRRRSSLSVRRLNVFTSQPEDLPVPDTGLTLWDLDLTHRIASATNLPPRNGFEEMLLWTKQGKLWQYPVNNEAGLEEEMLVPFHEHVFLEQHIAQGFPQQGPVRHFMELVVTGLSKNPYLTARQKQEHIAWFRDYFQEKQQVLEEAEA